MKAKKWFEFLTNACKKNVNVERVLSLNETTGLEVLDYVLNTIEYLDTKCPVIPYNIYIRKALQWSEVAKGIDEKDINYSKCDLSSHNIGSAEIYEIVSEDEEEVKKIVIPLIKGHGLIGQYIRGEISFNSFEPLFSWIAGQLDNNVDKEIVIQTLINLSSSVIGGINVKLVEENEYQINAIANNLVLWSITKNYEQMDMGSLNRIKRMKPNTNIDDISDLLSLNIKRYSFWFTEIALGEFNDDIFIKILSKATLEANELNSSGVEIKNINFKFISEFIYYDYLGKKKINVYKKRIIENFFEKNNSKHITMTFEVRNDTLFIGYELKSTCSKLVDFCVEAEKSGEISYEQAIVLIFDFFDFRKDNFDRLNNEDYYLGVMDDITNSKKGELVNYVEGDIVVDVGSGSGVLLNILEKKFPEKTIIGTDISSQVIENLKRKKKKENRTWEIEKHNFVDSPFSKKVDSIIFSSILHEIYSFNEIEGRKFLKESVEKSLINAFLSLKDGGILAIRDGIKTNSEEIVKLHLKKQEGKEFFLSFFRDFKGLTEINRNDIKYCSINSDDEKTFIEFVVTAPINYIREFMYTYTWGTESYSNEVKEQFGYFTIDEYKRFFNNLSINGNCAEIIICEEYFEQGYKDNLESLLTLTTIDDEELHYPNSNCIVVVRKN